LRPMRRLGAWVSGRRLPCLPLPDGGTTLELAGAVHACVPIGRADARAEARLIEAIRGTFPLPVTRHAAGSGAAAPWRAPAPRNPAVAVIRPDQEVAAVYSLSLEG